MRLVHLLLDETGSMFGKHVATIEGVNQYFDTIAEAPDVRIALTKFDDRGYRTLHEGFSKPTDATRLTKENYTPSGGTNLFDAVAHIIHETERFVSKLRDLNNVAQLLDGIGVLIVIYTDGEENSSVKQTVTSINSLIKAKEDQGWTFMYLGAEKAAWSNSAMFAGTMSGANVYKSHGDLGTRSVMHAAAASTTAWAAGGLGETAVIVDDDQKTTVLEHSN